MVEFSNDAPAVVKIPIPRFQELRTLRGDWQSIARGIEELKSNGSKAWLEIIYEGDEIAGSVREHLNDAIAGTGLEILRVKNNRVLERALHGSDVGETLDDLDVTDVFQRCLDAHQIPEGQRTVLLNTYQEVLVSINEQDLIAE